MKLISIESITSGESLSTNIHTSKGLVLLKYGSTLSESYIARLKSLGIYSVYVEDELFEDLEAIPSLRDETKAQLLDDLFNLQKGISRGNRLNVNAVRSMSGKITDEIRESISRPISLINTFAADYPVLLHCINTAVIASALSIKAGVKRELIENYVSAALVHDITLKSMEEDLNPAHAAEASTLLKNSASIGPTAYMAVAMHHERFDGSGKPKGVKSTAINEGARILAVADMYDNLVFGYGGLKRMPLHHAVEYILMESGKALDPELTNVFSICISVYPTGATVLLNNGKKAVVVAQNAGMPTRPVVCLTELVDNQRLEYNLLNENSLFVEKVYL